MSEILNIQELKKMAMPIIDIPDFEGTGTIKVRVQKPRLMAMAAQGKIPNHLLGLANDMTFGVTKKKQEDPNIKDTANMMELYCQACLVEPSYEEFKEIMTDEQMLAIFSWAMGKASELDNFRTDKKDGTSNNNGKALQKKTK